MGKRTQLVTNDTNEELVVKLGKYGRLAKQESAIHTAFDLWSTESFREDHYDGENGLYRLAARIPLKHISSAGTLLEYSHYLRGKLGELPVKPSRMSIHNDMFEIEWGARGYQVVSSKAQYMELILNFAQFLERNEFDDINMNIQIGFLSDDPGESIYDIPVNEVNFSPRFNKECFGWDGHLDVLFCRIDESLKNKKPKE